MLTLFLVKGIIHSLGWNLKATHVHRNGLHFIPGNRIIFDGHFSFLGSIPQPLLKEELKIRASLLDMSFYEVL